LNAVTRVTLSYVASASGTEPEPDASAFRSDARSIPTACTTPTKPPSFNTSSAVSGSDASPTRQSTDSLKRAALFADAEGASPSSDSGGVPRLETLVTSYPASSSSTQMRDPTKPVPPRTNTRPRGDARSEPRVLAREETTRRDDARRDFPKRPTPARGATTRVAETASMVMCRGRVGTCRKKK
jgi:hypothetical protein